MPLCLRSEEHTSELQSLRHLVCRLLLEKKKKTTHCQCCPRRTTSPAARCALGRPAARCGPDLPVLPCIRSVPAAPPSPVVFFFNDTATTEIYTLSLHDALPILRRVRGEWSAESSGGCRQR